MSDPLEVQLSGRSIGELHPDGTLHWAFVEEQTENLLRGDRAWTRRLPPAIALSASR